MEYTILPVLSAAVMAAEVGPAKGPTETAEGAAEAD
jgi:hypothetical protein